MLKYKLVAFDLDGTLLDEEKNVPRRNLEALRAAAERGCAIVPATGRILEGVHEAIRALPFIRYYILVNGALVYDVKENRTVYEGNIPLDTALRLCDYMDKLPLLYDCYQDGMGWMTKSMYESVDEYFTLEPNILPHVKRLRNPVESLPETLKQRGKSVQKMQMHFKPENMDERQRQLENLSRIFPELQATSSLKNNVEINSVNAGKGKALAAVCKELGIDIQDTVAFGDGTNDMEMLCAAGLGVAMANGAPSVKSAADAIALSNNEAGLGIFLEQLIASGKI